jgi:hypothetical protein
MFDDRLNEMGMTSSLHGPYELGYTRATMIITMRGNNDIYKLEQIFKNYLSSDYGLKLAHIKLESLVIAEQHAAVNMLLGFVHTARHIKEVNCF